MSVLSTIQSVCAVVALPPLVSVVGSTNPTAARMLGLLGEEAQSLLSRHDWSVLHTTVTITPTAVAGGVASYPLPADYQRLKGGGLAYNSGSRMPLSGPTSTADWQSITTGGTGGYRNWRIRGRVLEVTGNGPTDTVTLDYISRNIFEEHLGAPKAAITADTDLFRVDEHLFYLGLKYRWKKETGIDYGEQLSDYERHLERVATEDRGGGKVHYLGRRLVPDNWLPFTIQAS